MRSSRPIIVGVMAALLAGCGSASGPGAATTGGPDGCVRGTVPADLACLTFVSKSGMEGTSTVGWLGSSPLTVTFEELNATPTVVVLTPCNAINVPVTIDGRSLTPDARKMISTLMGCTGDASEQEGWARNFVAEPMTYELAGDQLTLSTANASVVLTKRT